MFHVKHVRARSCGVSVRALGREVGHWVVARTASRAAASEAADGEPAAADGAIALDRLVGVAGAGRLEAAGGAEARRDGALVEADKGEEHRPQERCAEDVMEMML